MSSRRRCVLVIASTLFISITSFADSNSARHGYIDDPPGRAFLCSSMGGNLNKMCGAVQYEPQSIEGPNGFPEKGPADGQIASAGNVNFKELNEQSGNRWHKVNMNNGKNTFTWTLFAPHRTASWQFFITKQDWDVNKPLTRNGFDLTPFCEQQDNGHVPAKVVKIECDVPERTGYQVILGVWTIADTTNAFYQVIDVNMTKSLPK